MTSPLQQVVGTVSGQMYVYDVGTLAWIAWDGQIVVPPLGAVTIIDGGDVAEGATTDAAVVTDSAGTVSGKLRGLIKILADVWNSATHKLKVEGSFSATPITAGTPTQSSVPDSAGNTPILGANANRLGFTLYNDSDQIAYVKLGLTASVTSFSKKMLPGDFYSTQDVGVNYTGDIEALWAADSTGSMRVTELTA